MKLSNALHMIKLTLIYKSLFSTTNSAVFLRQMSTNYPTNIPSCKQALISLMSLNIGTKPLV